MKIFHGTRKKHAAQIRRTGFKDGEGHYMLLNNDGTRPRLRGVFFTDKPNLANDFAVTEAFLSSSSLKKPLRTMKSLKAESPIGNGVSRRGSPIGFLRVAALSHRIVSPEKRRAISSLLARGGLVRKTRLISKW